MEDQNKKKQDSATKIQAIFRGYRTRKITEKQKHEKRKDEIMKRA